jgi:hypothetical protein
VARLSIAESLINRLENTRKFRKLLPMPWVRAVYALPNLRGVTPPKIQGPCDSLWFWSVLRDQGAVLDVSGAYQD